ncbi:MAG: NADH-quinone oxidoreductase subunit NuoE [Deltaproteobacteria bacterium]|nr:NADH-quinone oxidoreductase subunit NuoE [Deltaproteobacteria bacterium]
MVEPKEDLEEAKILQDIESRLDAFGRDRGSLIPILQMIQGRHRYLPKASLEMVGAYLGIPPSEVYGVATFYNQFRFNPPGKHPIRVCVGTACHVRGADIILENFERKLEIKEGQTTADREFSIEKVACVGCCALAPVALVGETVHGGMAPSKVEGLILRIAVENEMRQRAKDKEKQEE